MIEKLTIEKIIDIVRVRPEQGIFDWKRDLKFSNEDEKSEVIKDIVAIANATFDKPGFIFYGIDPNREDPILGISMRLDDANLQQLLKDKVSPGVKFLYYEAIRPNDQKRIGVIYIPPSHARPHIMVVNFGKLRDGQIIIRRGSSTSGIRFQDLSECFYGATSPYIKKVLQQYGALANQKMADIAYMRELREQERQINREIEFLTGLPPGSLGD